jgi:hypothetical protein
MKVNTKEKNDAVPSARLIEGQTLGNGLCASAQEHM